MTINYSYQANMKELIILRDKYKKLKKINAELLLKIESRSNKLAEYQKAFSNISDRTSRHDELMFLQKRIVAVYGNKALVNLLLHFENPSYAKTSPEKLKEHLEKVRPVF